MSAVSNPSVGCLLGHSRLRRRKGAVLVLAAFLMVILLAMLAFSVDLGYVMTVQTELKRATDAAALAGAGALVDGSGGARLQAFEFFARNPVGGVNIGEGDGWEDNLENLLAEHEDDFEIELGHWDPDSESFVQGDILPSTIRVATSHNNASLFFGRILGRDSFDVTAESIARYFPRDIVLVLDFSASMNYDSQLRRIQELGSHVRDDIEANLLQIYQELGSPVYGSLQFEPQYDGSYDNNQIKVNFGLRYRSGWQWVDIPYPYPSGSWDDYIDYVKTDNYVNSAGYRRKFGYLTLVNYWLARQPTHNQTPDLWKASAQPVDAVKDAVGVFMQYIQAVDCEDRVGLVVYNSYSQDSVLEHELTDDFAQVEDTVQHRQAGHYDWYTNIGAGLRRAHEELDANARVGSFKMIVLMTDGLANKPYNTSYAKSYVISQAELAAEKRYPVVTISLGNDADADLMQQVADITSGAHFNLPGGQSVVDFEDDLMEVFRKIADDRPLVLVR